MGKGNSYTAHKINSDGTIPYNMTDNETWKYLYKRQMEVIKDRAHPDFIKGIEVLSMDEISIPQPPMITKALEEETSWGVEPVEAVIPAEDFFRLLANRKFPAASFIRSMEEVDYLQEPDIFHELYGHCPLLTNPHYAKFVEAYGKLSLTATPKQRKFLFRIFWYTIEFGLMKTSEGLRIYGGGILSSKEETLSCLDLSDDSYIEFDVQTALRTPFRIDIVQKQYFVIESFEKLFSVLENDIFKEIEIASEAGDFPPNFEYKKGSKNARYN